MAEPVETVEPAAEALPPAPAAPSSPQEIAAANPLVRSGARWFWWIAGLSVVNIAMFQSGSHTSFVMGLAITQIFDAVFVGNKAIGFAIDAFTLGFFVYMGLLAQEGKLKGFYLGIGMYVIDALIYATFADWMPVAFHVLAIFFISKGAMALRDGLNTMPAPAAA